MAPPDGPVPVIISHFGGKQKYLRYALKSAQKYNDIVVLLGDDSNQAIWSEHWNCTNKTSTKYESFLKHYRKMSFYSNAFDTSFWKRLFMMDLWMEETHHGHSILLDSDVITFSNYSETIQPFFKDNSYAGMMTPKQQDNYVWISSGHFSYW